MFWRTEDATNAKIFQPGRKSDTEKLNDGVPRRGVYTLKIRMEIILDMMATIKKTNRATQTHENRTIVVRREKAHLTDMAVAPKIVPGCQKHLSQARVGVRQRFPAIFPPVGSLPKQRSRFLIFQKKLEMKKETAFKSHRDNSRKYAGKHMNKSMGISRFREKERKRKRKARSGPDLHEYDTNTGKRADKL